MHFVAGVNENSQLGQHPFNEEDQEDVRKFSPNNIWKHVQCKSEDVRVLWSTSALTVYLGGNTLVVLGPKSWTQDLPEGLASSLHDVFGNHDEMHGCLDASGRLWSLKPGSNIRQRELVCHPRQTTGGAAQVSIAHIAESNEGRVCLSLTIDANNSELLSFVSLEAFHRWYGKPTSHGPEWRRMLPARVEQICGSSIAFLCLRSDGVVMSWGKSWAHSLTLGRNLHYAADVPAVIPQLRTIKKIASKGYMGAALESNGTLWFWGLHSDFGTKFMKPLKDIRAKGQILAQFPKTRDDGTFIWPVMDFAVGGDHIVAVDETGSLWVMGENFNGQLGLKERYGEDEPKYQDNWCSLAFPFRVKQVSCGPRSTFIYTDDVTE